MKKLVQIVKAVYFKNYKLQLDFSDGKSQIVDFGPFMMKSGHEDIRKYLALSKFKKFKLVDGELMWGDFDLIFPVIDLYENNIDRALETFDSQKAAKIR